MISIISKESFDSDTKISHIHGMNDPHIWRRPTNGVYYAVYMDQGKQRKKSLGTRDEKLAKKQFKLFMARLIAGKVKPLDAPGSQIRFYDFCNQFLEFTEATKRTGTYDLYRVALDKAKASWGNIPTRRVTARHIDGLVTDMVKAGLKTPTINKNYRHIKGALNKAHEWGYLPQKIKFPKMLDEEEVVRYLEIDDIRKLISAIDDPEFIDFCMLSAYSGLRSGEIIRLQWEDIDNPAGFIRIASKQKNKSESRIPINQNMTAILDRCRDRAGGKPFRFNQVYYVSQLFRKYADAAGLPGIRFHDLRHTFASHLAMGGKSGESIQALMRHKSYASTQKYLKLSPDYLREVSDSLNYGPMPVPNPIK